MVERQLPKPEGSSTSGSGAVTSDAEINAVSAIDSSAGDGRESALESVEVASEMRQLAGLLEKFPMTERHDVVAHLERLAELDAVKRRAIFTLTRPDLRPPDDVGC